jgi:hypothetical protein
MAAPTPIPALALLLRVLLVVSDRDVRVDGVEEADVGAEGGGDCDDVGGVEGDDEVGGLLSGVCDWLEVEGCDSVFDDDGRVGDGDDDGDAGGDGDDDGDGDGDGDADADAGDADEDDAKPVVGEFGVELMALD